jgi:hypothetical protein
MSWSWPLPQQRKRMLPELWTPAAFGAVRKYDVHTGVDLYCRFNEPVCAVEAGTVVGIEHFTGPYVDSPWWLDTWAVLVEGPSGVICYGELEQKMSIEVGMVLHQDDFVGLVARVLPAKKGRHSTMLHLELYKPGTRKTVWWHLGKPQPKQLLDPTVLLRAAATCP